MTHKDQIFRKLSHQEIVDRQLKKQNQPKLPFCVLLNNIRSLHNVGSIFRTCDGVGIEKLWLCGITGYPPQAPLSKTSLGAEDHVPWEYRQDAAEVLRELKAQGYQIIFLEQIEGSRSHDEFIPEASICLVLGNEIEGIAEELLPFCDETVEIEMVGIKNSLNVSVAFGVVVYHFRHFLKKRAS